MWSFSARRRSCSPRTACQICRWRSSAARWAKPELWLRCSQMRGRTEVTNGPRMMTPSRSKLTTGAAWLWCGGEGAIHDAIHHAALHIDHIRIAGGILTKRADLDWLKAELDALPALVRSSAQREDATGAQVAKQVMAHQRGRGWTSVDVAADDRAV